VLRLSSEKLVFIGVVALQDMRLMLPKKQDAVVKGHKGVRNSGMGLANGLINSNIGIWRDTDQLVANNLN
jgi:hypothetical protein